MCDAEHLSWPSQARGLPQLVPFVLASQEGWQGLSEAAGWRCFNMRRRPVSFRLAGVP